MRAYIVYTRFIDDPSEIIGVFTLEAVAKLVITEHLAKFGEKPFVQEIDLDTVYTDKVSLD